MKKILEVYKGFEGLSSVVDFGGGIGASLHMIVSQYPNVKGINFDLSHVIENAPPLTGKSFIICTLHNIFLNNICIYE